MFSATKIVLIVDREDDVLELLKAKSESIDYVALEAKTGDEALGVLSRLTSYIDLTIIDLDLSLDDGVLMRLLAIFASRTPTTKVIVKTSRHDTPFLEQVTYLGVDAYVLRPLSEEVLIETVRATLSDSGTFQPEYYVELRPSPERRFR